MLQAHSHPQCMLGSLSAGSRQPFTHSQLSPLQRRRPVQRACRRRQQCRAALDVGSSERITPSAETADSLGSSRMQQRPQQFVEVSAAPPTRQETAAFLGTPKGAAAALAVAGLAGLGLRALFGSGSRCCSVPPFL